MIRVWLVGAVMSLGVVATVQSAHGSDRQTASPKNEALLFASNGAFGGISRSDDRAVALQYYRSLTPRLKLFGELGVQRWYDAYDQFAGAGGYYVPDRKNSFYWYASCAFNPKVRSNLDATAEYSRLLFAQITGSVGYRFMLFPGERVHILLPALTAYTLPRWTLTGRGYVAKLESSSEVSVAVLLQVFHDWSDTFTPFVSYAAGNELYRASPDGAIVRSSAWSAGAGARIAPRRDLRLRLGYEYLRRIGLFEQHTVSVSTSFLW